MLAREGQGPRSSVGWHPRVDCLHYHYANNDGVTGSRGRVSPVRRRVRVERRVPACGCVTVCRREDDFRAPNNDWRDCER